HQDGGAGVADVVDDPENLLDDVGGEPERRLVEHHQLSARVRRDLELAISSRKKGDLSCWNWRPPSDPARPPHQHRRSRSAPQPVASLSASPLLKKCGKFLLSARRAPDAAARHEFRNDARTMRRAAAPTVFR